MISTSYLIGFDIGVIAFTALIIWLKVSGDRAEREAQERRLSGITVNFQDEYDTLPAFS